MTCLRALVLSATWFLVQACGSSTTISQVDAGTDPEGPGDGCLNELYQGVALEPGITIIACDLAPGSDLIDVVDGVVYTTSPRGAFFRDDLAAGTRTRLHQSLADRRTATYLDGQIYFDAIAGTDEGVRRPGMFAISAEVPTPANPRLLSYARNYAVGGRMLTDGLVRYVSESGRQSVLELDVLSGSTRRVVNGDAVGLSPNWLYYCGIESEVRRVRRDGSEDQLLAASSVSARPCGLRAVDEDGIYLTRQDAPYEIWRFGPDGREDFIGAGFEGAGGDSVLPPPIPIAVQGPWVYARHQSASARGTGAYDFLTRIGVDREEQSVVSGIDVGQPLFRDGFLYLAMTRNQLDGPVDGVVLRIDEASLGPSA